MRQSNRHKSNTFWATARFVFAATLSMVASSAVLAAESPAFQTSIFAGYNFGGNFYKANADGDDTDQLKVKPGANFGIALNFREEDNAYYEVFYSRQNATIEPSFDHAYDMSIEYLHVGGFVELGDLKGKAVPYFVLTFGATRLTPTNSVFDRTIDPSIALGGGVRIPFTKNIGLRLEGRGFATFIKSDSNLFCGPSTTTDANGNSVTVKVCETNIQGHSILQAQASIALTIGF